MNVLGIIALIGLPILALLIFWRATRTEPREHFSSDTGLDHLAGSGRLHGSDKRREDAADDADGNPDD